MVGRKVKCVDLKVPIFKIIFELFSQKVKLQNAVETIHSAISENLPVPNPKLDTKSQIKPTPLSQVLPV